MRELSGANLESVCGGVGTPGDGWTDAMSNGCGNGYINVPNGSWRQACVDHDHRYFDGGTSAQRLAADRSLRTDMIKDGASPLVADAYYAGVRTLGWTSWGNKHPVNPGKH
ncbi:MAG TPA: hypothetical protein VGL61_08960 [Kofleriaceae bacterium]|jgi:hypothetical protein